MPRQFLAAVYVQATAVYGQPDLNSNSSGIPVGSTTLRAPGGLAVDGDGRLLVADTNNNRILIFPSVPSTAGNISAIDVIGQSNFSSNSPVLLNLPQGIAFDAKYNCLWVADSGNNRVLRFPLGVVVDNNATNVVVNFAGRTPDVTISPKRNAPPPPAAGRPLCLTPGRGD